MSITTITRSLSESAIISGMKDLHPDLAATFPVTVQGSNTFAESDPYFMGVRFHAFLRRIADNNTLSDFERAMLPWLNSLRTGLRAEGVKRFDPLVEYAETAELPSGEPDLVVTGGVASCGIVEIKVTGNLPDNPAPEHLLQLGGYVAHEQRENSGNVWAAVAYVSFREPKIQLYAYRDTRALTYKAYQLLGIRAA